MPAKPLTVSAIIGATLIALLLQGSTRNAANSPALAVRGSDPIARLNAEGKRLFAQARYFDARESFQAAAVLARDAGDAHRASMNWNNAGACSVATMQFGVAMKHFTLARRTAESSHQLVPLAYTLNNLASLYIHMGQPENALRIARGALDGPAGNADNSMRARLLLQMGNALFETNQPDQGAAFYRQGIEGLMDLNELEAAARAWGGFGNDSLKAGRLDQAEWALSEGLRLVRTHRLNASASILSGLGRLRSLQGNQVAAASLFEAALAAPPNLTPRWKVYSDRGAFRLRAGHLPGALDDFREARNIAARMRADVVPADQDRIALEGGLGVLMEGFVDAGNRLFVQKGDPHLLRETFDVAEQDRLWSLRALVPSPDDWRARLPERYWEALARYQPLERLAAEKKTPEIEKKAAQLRTELQEIEASAAGPGNAGPPSASTESPIEHIQKVLDRETVLISFHITNTSSWVWAVDQARVNVYPLPPLPKIRREAEEFARAVKEGAPVPELGREIYKDLFGAVPETYLRHPNWLLELDGPLYDLPFATLVSGQKGNRPEYLIERATLQSVPSALLLERGVVPAGGTFLGIGDPVYNTADARFHGRRGKPDLTLPRLPNTAGELEACARAWNYSGSRFLIGSSARMGPLLEALKANPAIIHFATHVVIAPDEFRSGLIALSLGEHGAMELLGPKEIVARPVDASLVVMDGCHSAQGDALPSSGRMGLTRAWIGAGAKAVLATKWDVPDEAAESLMVRFYSALRASPERGAAYALREAQLEALSSEGEPFGRWAGYFLLSRTL